MTCPWNESPNPALAGDNPFKIMASLVVRQALICTLRGLHLCMAFSDASAQRLTVCPCGVLVGVDQAHYTEKCSGAEQAASRGVNPTGRVQSVLGSDL